MNTLENIDKYRDIIMKLLSSVPFNTLFARAVVEKAVKGEIFADNANNPQTFYILHPYGMSLLLGNSSNNDFSCSFKEYVQNINKARTKVEWMQAYPNDWHTCLRDLFNESPDLIEVDTRVNFKFNREKHLANKKHAISDESEIRIARTTINDYELMAGSVIPKYFWNNSSEFIRYGIGYSLFYQNHLAATAFSSVVDGKYLELGIETQEQFKGRNFAYKVCSALIDYCLEEGLEPVWACRLSNVGSYKLAEKLGFEESLTTPYYKMNY